MDFAALQNGVMLLDDFTQSTFTLQCLGCVALVQAATPASSPSSRVQYTTSGSAHFPTANVNLWNWTPLTAGATQPVLRMLTNQQVQTTSSTGSTKWYQAQVSCRECFLKLDSGGGDLYFEMTSGGEHGVDTAAVLAKLNLFAKIALEVSLGPSLSNAFDSSLAWEGPLSNSEGHSLISQLNWDVQMAGVAFSSGLALELRGQLKAQLSRSVEVNSSFVARYGAEFGYTYRYDRGLHPFADITNPAVTSSSPGVLVDDVGSLSMDLYPSLKAGMWVGGDLSGPDVAQLSADMTSRLYSTSQWGLALRTFSTAVEPSAGQTSFGPCQAGEHNIQLQGQVGVGNHTLEVAFRAPLQWNGGEEYPGYSWKGAWGPYNFASNVEANTGYLFCKCQPPACSSESISSPPSSSTAPPNSSSLDFQPPMTPDITLPSSNVSLPDDTNITSPNGTNTTLPNDVNPSTNTSSSLLPPPSPLLSTPPPPVPKPSPPPRTVTPVVIIGGGSTASETATFDVEATMRVVGVTYLSFQDPTIQQKFTLAVAEIIAPVSVSRISVKALHPSSAVSGRRRSLLQALASVDLEIRVSSFADQTSATQAKDKLESSVSDGSLATAATWQLSVYSLEVTGITTISIGVVVVDNGGSASPSSEAIYEGDLELMGFAVPKMYLGAGVVLIVMFGCVCCFWRRRTRAVTPTEQEDAEKLLGEGKSENGEDAKDTPLEETDASKTGANVNGVESLAANKEKTPSGTSKALQEENAAHVATLDEAAERVENQQTAEVDPGEPRTPSQELPPATKKKLDPLGQPGDLKPVGHKDVMSNAMKKRGGWQAVTEDPKEKQSKSKPETTSGDQEPELAEVSDFAAPGPKRRGHPKDKGKSPSQYDEQGNEVDYEEMNPLHVPQNEITNGDALSSQLLTPVFDAKPLPPPLNSDERDLMFWLKEQCLENHFESFREKGVRSIEDVIFRVDPVMLAEIGQMSRMQARLILSSIKMQKMLINVHRMQH